MQDDSELFWREMGDVTPLKGENKADVGRPPSAESVAIAERRRQALEAKQKDPNYLAEDYVEMIDEWEVLSYKRDGVQNGVFRKLKLGKYPYDIRLDLHRMKVERARREVYQIVQECLSNDVRSLLIIHGKGLSQRLGQRGGPQPGDKAVLKSFVNHWLRQIPEVLAFHSAQPAHGGAGAIYVLLRKSEQRKEENRRRFIAGRDKVPYYK